MARDGNRHCCLLATQQYCDKAAACENLEMDHSEHFPEISDAARNKKHELKITGEAAQRGVLLKAGLLPDELFALDHLHQLTVADVKLAKLGDRIQKLHHLHSLLLYSNLLTEINPCIFQIQGLKVLDLSRNKVETVSKALSSLVNLTHLNLSENSITRFPDEDEVMSMPNLQCLNLSRNRLDKFPNVCAPENGHLSDLLLSGNEIVEIPPAINKLSSLKVFEMSGNKLKKIPYEVAEIPKLKDIDLKDNDLEDNRLKKLIIQCRTKQIVDYVKQHSARGGVSNNAETNEKGKKSKKGKGNAKTTETSGNSADELCNRMSVLHVEDDTFNVKTDENVKNVRPHIVCCVVRGLRFTEETFKKFIQMQTKLHDTICEKRNAATIATHDLAKLAPGDLLYTARLPQNICIQPLSRTKTYTGQELYLQLQHEAENLRKEKKRNVYSGVHKYLYLLEGKKIFPCLEDSAGRVISFPPITNSEITKMSHESTSMLVEVTSTQNQSICRKVLDAFLLEVLNLGAAEVIDPEHKFHNLKIQQIKIVDLEGGMRVVYPSKVDLVYESSSNVKIVR